MDGEKFLFGALTVYRERGAFLRRLEQFEKSLAAYDEAFRSVADGANVRMLVGRSQVNGDAVKPQQAYADAELALRLEPRNMIARNMQARAMYTMSDFEHSLVINHRGARVRIKPSYFREGINQGLETIQDCIGENAGSVMLDFLHLIKEMEAEKSSDDDNFAKSKHVSRIPKPELKKKLTQMEARQHEILSRVMAMKYLGPMAYDKFFLQELMHDNRVMSANSNGSAKLKSIIAEAVKSLNDRQEMLRLQRPYYTVKFAEKSDSKYQTKYKEAILVKERQIGTRTADRLIKSIEKCLREKKVNNVMALAERMQNFLDTKSPRTLPEKYSFLDRLYRAVGAAYLCQHRLSYRLSERGNKRRIAFLMGLQVGRPRSFDSVIAQYPFKFIDINEATKKVKLTLEMCENATIKCWLQYEMARLLTSQKNYALAKYYAKRCQRDAQEINSPPWWLNGCFAIMSGDMQQGNMNEVRILVEEAYERSKEMAESELLQSFLAKCAELANATVAVDDGKAIRQREKDIIRVVSVDMRAETGVLFKRMSTVPEGRRFAVLPGNTLPRLRDPAVRHKRRQRGLTIVPGPEPTLPAPPHSEVPGFLIFET